MTAPRAARPRPSALGVARVGAVVHPQPPVDIIMPPSVETEASLPEPASDAGGRAASGAGGSAASVAGGADPSITGPASGAGGAASWGGGGGAPPSVGMGIGPASGVGGRASGGTSPASVPPPPLVTLIAAHGEQPAGWPSGAQPERRAIEAALADHLARSADVELHLALPPPALRAAVVALAHVPDARRSVIAEPPVRARTHVALDPRHGALLVDHATPGDGR